MDKKMFKLITFRNQLFSPKKYKNYAGKRFPGQIIPAETCQRTTTEEENEPTSPKISCLGKVKHKGKQRKNKKLAEGKKAKESYLRGFFVRPQAKRLGEPRPHPKVPDLSHMRRYASGRDTLAGFDWRAHEMSHMPLDGENEVMIPFSAPMIIDELRGCGIIKPKKEINLWKRRTMSQPRLLQVV